MNAGEHVRLRFVLESGGVQMMNQHYILLNNSMQADPVNTILDGVANNFWNAVKNNMSTSTKLAAMLWDNLDVTEQYISYQGGLVGTGTANAHPQFTMLPVEIYALVGVPGSKTLKRNRFFMSGISEERSVRGRVIDTATFLPLTSYLLNGQTTGPTGLDYSAIVRYQVTAGPPPTYAYELPLDVQVASRFRTHRNRRSKALGLA